MKTQIKLAVALVTGILSGAVMAQEVNSARWSNFCKHNEKKCEHAMYMCESRSEYTCDQIKWAFLEKRQLPNQRATKPAQNTGK